ncbi:ScbA/BarX family gamma-butyrolactone biosynthesis protein [Streptomyces sp. NPDC004266]|uniref:ScbA/BarX family gamma-butyrolactone biosynthesis protein n=1 Tax=Streptomyces sp. NPDC004266 TaxID=3364693 RepID=UPI0036A5B398
MLIKERSEVLATPLTTTVPREYVHRAALSEVFLTGWHRNGPDSFTVTAQWPRSHCFYGSEHGLYDPLMLCETVRQTFPLLAHAAYDMPFGYQLSWRDLRYEIDPAGLHVKGAPAEVELRVSCSDIRYLRSVPASIRMHIELVRDGVPFAVVETEFGCHSPEVYRRLRAGRGDAVGMFLGAPLPTSPVPPGLVGRGRDQDVVLSPSGELGRWRLRVDTTHPVLFDHPVDHVPGMVLLESVRQAAHALNPSRGSLLPLFMDVRFNRYVEFDSPCRIEAEALPGESAPGRHRLRVNALQGEASAFSAVAETAVVSAF